MDHLKLSLKLSIISIVSHGCGIPEHAPADAGEPATQSRNDNDPLAQYRHPLQMAGEMAEEEGLLPYVDSIDSIDGHRFVAIDAIHVDEDGEATSFSGIKRMPVQRPDSPPESSPTQYPTGEEKLGGPLKAAAQALIDGAQPNELLTAIVQVRRPFVETLTGALNLEIAQGKVTTPEEYEVMRASHIAARKATLSGVLLPLAESIAANGGEVIYVCENAPCLIARAPAQHIHDLAENSDVLRMDAPAAAHLETSGSHVRKGSQIDQYVDLANPFNGARDDADSQFDNLRFAIMDGGYANHPSFNDGPLNHDPGDPTSRILFYRKCGAVAACSGPETFCTGGMNCDHDTGVASILFGDLWDNQINTLSTTDRDNFTGYAGEALGYLYTYTDDDGLPLVDSTSAAWIKVFDNVEGLNPKPVVLNVSAGIGKGHINDIPTALDPGYPSKWDHCNGTDSVSIAANDLFEAGILIIKSAGNQGVENGTAECTITIPGSAAGVFTVGNHNGGNTGGVNEVRNKDLSASSSRGPTPTNLDRGRGRTIIDVTAFGARNNLADSSPLGGWYSQPGVGGTSFAAPVVSAGAISFVDHFKTVYSDLVDDPGILFANLLLMGDRANGDKNAKILTGFDRGFGAGRLKMRKFDDSAMGTPWGYETGMECIAEHESLQYYLNFGSRLPEGVDTLKMVAWWYDRRHEAHFQNAIADIDLKLWKVDDFGQKVGAMPVAESISPTDDKERITFLDPDLGGNSWLVEIHGVDNFDAGFTYGGCRLSGYITLYTALYYESSERNAEVDGPFFSNSTGVWIGVEPEDVVWP